MPSTSTSGPHHANRTSWASAASAGTDSGERRQRGQLVGLERSTLVDQRVGGGGHQGAGVHGRGPYRPT